MVSRSAFLLMLAVGTATATTRVSSLDEFRQAISEAVPGDHIVLADGLHSASETIRIDRAGTAESPIIVEAESIGGAEISGRAGFTFAPPAAYLVIRGFKFSHRAGTMDVPAGVNHCRITRNIFQMAIPKGAKAAFLTVSGDDHEIDHNTFQHKETEGQMLYIQGPGRDGMAQRTWIHHNYFFDFKPTANNCSALHIGHSARSLTPAHSVVEYNLFIQCRGENEGAICNKSCDNIYRYNTIGEGSTELSLRHGNRCEVYGNYFLGSAGLRFFGDEHRIFSNYFQDCRPAIAIGNGGANVPPAKLTSHDRPDGVQVVYNTLVNNRSNVRMSGRNGGLGATDLVFANNIIVGGSTAVSIDGPLPNAQWEGNLLWNNEGGPGDIPESGFTTLDPLLKMGSDGIYRIQAESPAIGKGVGDYPYVTRDIDGQPRRGELDPGADQHSIAQRSNRVLTVNEVGPHAPEKPRPLFSRPVR